MVSQMMRAPSSRSNPATPHPSAGMTSDSAPRSSAASECVSGRGTDALGRRLAVAVVGHRGRVDDVLRVEVERVRDGDFAEVHRTAFDGGLVERVAAGTTQCTCDA